MESLYGCLKRNIGKDIIVSYYTNFKKLKTQKFKLIALRDFDKPNCMHMIVNGKLTTCDMYFFSQISLIKSITIPTSNHPIYFNPYIEKYLNQPYNNPIELEKKIKKAFLDNTPQNKIISEIELFLLRYYTRGKFNFEDLFYSEKQRQEFDLFFALLIDDLTKQAKKHNLDATMRKIDDGSTSLIYSIGDKIVKIGKARDNKVIPYCEYLLQPILNREIMFDNIPIRIEVTERVISYKSLNKDDQDAMRSKFEQAVIDLGKQLKQIGLKCYDLNIYNIGILIHDNIIHFDTIPLETGYENTTSIKNNNSLQVRKKGEFIILDLDALEIENYRKYCNYLKKIGYILDKNKTKSEDYGKQLTIKYVD